MMGDIRHIILLQITSKYHHPFKQLADLFMTQTYFPIRASSLDIFGLKHTENLLN